MKKKILITLLAVFVSSIIGIGLLEFSRYLQDNEDVKSTSVKGVFLLRLNDELDGPSVKHLYSFTVSPNGDESKSVEWGAVGRSTKVELIGKEKIEEFDGCFVELSGGYIEFPTKESSANHHLFKRLKIRLIFN